MGWLTKFLDRTRGASPVDLLFIPSLTVAGEEQVVEAIKSDECYVELYVESLRLTRARSLATSFHGVVYSFVTLARDGEANSHLAAISKPEKLALLDKSSLDKVIQVSKQIMGAVPWRGGNLGLELGLFSVKSGNFLSPILDYVTRVSTAAGISFVGSVKPFLPLITEGMDILANQGGETLVEVAVDTSVPLTKAMLCAIIAAPKSTIDLTKLTVDPTDHKLLFSGAPLERGYCVFSIRRNFQKSDFGEIPELKQTYAAVQAAIRSNKRKDADDALTAFRLAALTCPDLITSDARKLVARAQDKVKEAFPGGGVSKKLTVTPKHENLSEIGLYQ